MSGASSAVRQATDIRPAVQVQPQLGSYSWMEWSPRGEGIDGPKNRADFGMLMLRIMANNPSWTQSPDKVTKPGMEAAVMGPYLPKGEYTTKAAFEANGLKK